MYSAAEIANLADLVSSFMYVLLQFILILVSLISITSIVINRNKFIDFMAIAFFGPEKVPNYRELLGVICMAGFVVMLYNHFAVPGYEPSMPLLTACLGYITTLAGITQSKDLVSKWLEGKNKKNSTENEA